MKNYTIKFLVAAVMCAWTVLPVNAHSKPLFRSRRYYYPIENKTNKVFGTNLKRTTASFTVRDYKRWFKANPEYYFLAGKETDHYYYGYSWPYLKDVYYVYKEDYKKTDVMYAIGRLLYEEQLDHHYRNISYYRKESQDLKTNGLSLIKNAARGGYAPAMAYLGIIELQQGNANAAKAYIYQAHDLGFEGADKLLAAIDNAEKTAQLKYISKEVAVATLIGTAGFVIDAMIDEVKQTPPSRRQTFWEILANVTDQQIQDAVNGVQTITEMFRDTNPPEKEAGTYSCTVHLYWSDGDEPFRKIKYYVYGDMGMKTYSVAVDDNGNATLTWDPRFGEKIEAIKVPFNLAFNWEYDLDNLSLTNGNHYELNIDHH